MISGFDGCGTQVIDIPNVACNFLRPGNPDVPWRRLCNSEKRILVKCTKELFGDFFFNVHCRKLHRSTVSLNEWSRDVCPGKDTQAKNSGRMGSPESLSPSRHHPSLPPWPPGALTPPSGERILQYTAQWPFPLLNTHDIHLCRWVQFSFIHSHCCVIISRLKKKKSVGRKLACHYLKEKASPGCKLWG